MNKLFWQTTRVAVFVVLTTTTVSSLAADCPNISGVYVSNRQLIEINQKDCREVSFKNLWPSKFEEVLRVELPTRERSNRDGCISLRSAQLGLISNGFEVNRTALVDYSEHEIVFSSFSNTHYSLDQNGSLITDFNLSRSTTGSLASGVESCVGPGLTPGNFFERKVTTWSRCTEPANQDPKCKPPRFQ